jgi:large subunit ribosomal protein L19
MSDLVRLTALKGLTKNAGIADFKSGDTVGVYVRVREGEKERVQLYKGIVLKIQGSGVGRSFTVRKMSSGVGVERTFPFTSPVIDRVELISRGQVRRSKLYFLRNLRGKAATITSELVGTDDAQTTKDKAAAKAATAAAAKSAAPAKN